MIALSNRVTALQHLLLSTRWARFYAFGYLPPRLSAILHFAFSPMLISAALMPPNADARVLASLYFVIYMGPMPTPPPLEYYGV